MRLKPNREPDFVIAGRGGQSYLRRWWIILRNRWFNIYLHHFPSSDDDRARHDHMYFNLSILLRGRYTEHTIKAGGVRRAVEYVAGSLKLRSPWTAHRIEIKSGEECWSLFITGPRMRSWGFHCPNGWRHWKDFVDDRDIGKVGKGCEG